MKKLLGDWYETKRSTWRYENGSIRAAVGLNPNDHLLPAYLMVNDNESVGSRVFNNATSIEVARRIASELISKLENAKLRS